MKITRRKIAGLQARKEDYTFRVLTSPKEVRSLVAAHHYAKGSSTATVLTVGMYRGEVLVGGALWLPPTKPCARSVNKREWRRVLSLSRLVITPSEPKNAASMLIGFCLRTLKAEKKWASVVTFADTSQGHGGTIYRATNWTYLGLTRAHQRWLTPEGQQVSILATKSRTKEEMLALGYRIEGSYRKHKFVMHLLPRSWRIRKKRK